MIRVHVMKHVMCSVLCFQMELYEYRNSRLLCFFMKERKSLFSCLVWPGESVNTSLILMRTNCSLEFKEFISPGFHYCVKHNARWSSSVWIWISNAFIFSHAEDITLYQCVYVRVYRTQYHNNPINFHLWVKDEKILLHSCKTSFNLIKKSPLIWTNPVFSRPHLWGFVNDCTPDGGGMI